jgi:transcriptional regulator with XRE-family HTH domain
MSDEPTRLGRTLERLRTRERLSRRELGSLSGVSGPQIGEIEMGRKGKQPSPNTLRSLARGLAMIPPENETVDEVKLRAYYQALMADAGYLSGLPTREDEPSSDDYANGTTAPSVDQVLAYLERETDDREFAEQLLRLVRAYRRADAPMRRQIGAVVGAVAGPQGE